MLQTEKPTPPQPKLLDTAEAAAMLRMARGTLVVWRAENAQPNLKLIKIGTNVRYLESDVLAFIELQRMKQVEKATPRRKRSRRSLQREKSSAEPREISQRA